MEDETEPQSLPAQPWEHAAPVPVPPPHPPVEHPAPPPHPTVEDPKRRLPVRGGIALLVAGLLLGGGAAYGVTRLSPTTDGSVTVHVDNSPVSAGTNNAEAVAQQLTPAVGTIIARTGGTSASLGSGFVIAHGAGTSYLVTNNHVVTGSTDLHLLMPTGSSFSATLVGADKLDDLAVVSVPDASLPVATFGDSSQLQVGQAVIAIGSPLGNQSSVTSGVISALHRTISASGDNSTSSETLEDVLQTDASINPGNSGGPLADVQGRVVGVNVAIAGNATNIGYSIPANLARQVASEIMAHQKVQHPFLGIGYLDAIDAIEAGKGFNGAGVLVTQVTSGTPAASAGFQVNDILVAIDGVAIENGQTLGGLIQSKQVGDHITCTVRRGSQTLTLTAALEERPGGV